MASPVGERECSNSTGDEHEPAPAPKHPEQSHPEPACIEAQKWIEAVTGRSFGDKDFRGGLENGILLCELLSSIKPGLVKKINRLPTPIAGLDNLSVFLKGCEELGLKGSQLFDPGDLQDTSIRANLKDSDCSRKLKNVLITVLWLGKAASGNATYNGPTLNIKEFEGLLSHMRTECEEAGDCTRRSVRDSGYDCWDSERSDSLSPPRHARDDSLDSLDSFGSRSQHSPSPDVANRGNSDGDSEVDNRKPDVRRDDMLARRTAGSGESRSSVPFNQFLPNRANATAYVPTPRRKVHAEDGEQRSRPDPIVEGGQGLGVGRFKRPAGPRAKTLKTVTWAPENGVDQGAGSHEEEGHTQEEEGRNQEAGGKQRRLQMLEKAGIKVLPAAVRYSSIPKPPALEEQEVRSQSPSIILRCDNEFLTNHKADWDSSSDGEGKGPGAGPGGAGRKVPDVQRDDLASRRAPRTATAPRVHQFVPPPACSRKDRERWEDIRRASQQALQEREISDREAVPDIITRRDNPFLNSAPRREEEENEEGEGEGGDVKTIPNKHKDDLAHRRAQNRARPHRDGPMSFVPAPMTQSDLEKWERLRMAEPSEPSPAPLCKACLEKGSGSPVPATATAGQGRSKVVTFGGVTELQQPISTIPSGQGEESELLKRMLAKATVAMPTIGMGSPLTERAHSRFRGADPAPAPPPSTCLTPRVAEAPPPSACLTPRVAEAPPPSACLTPRVAEAPPPSTCLTPRVAEAPPTPAVMEARLAQYGRRMDEEEEEEEDDEEEEEERVPDVHKDDMMARRTGVFHKSGVATATFNRFLPLPASKRSTQEVVTDACPRNRKEVHEEKNRKQKERAQPRQHQPNVPMDTLQPPVDTATVVRATPQCEWDDDENEDDEYDEDGPVPDLEKDDMMARRTRANQKSVKGGVGQSFNLFLPVPGSVKLKQPPASGQNYLSRKRNPTDMASKDSSIVSGATAPQQAPPFKALLRKGPGLGEREMEGGVQGEEPGREETLPRTSVSGPPNPSVPLSPPAPTLTPPPTPPPAQISCGLKEVDRERGKERSQDRGREGGDLPWRRPSWLEDDDLPPMMMSRRVANVTEDSESMSMSDMRSEEEGEHVQPLGQSRYERMQEQYNHNLEEEDHWRDDLARWKNRRRSASQELIRKEEERKRMEKRMKEEGMDAHKRKSIKTYREIVEEKERREAELCEAYRRAETPEEAAMVLQRYALRFTISDATLDSLKLPRIGLDYQPDSTKPDLKIKPAHTTVDQEQRVARNGQENQSKPEQKQEAEKNDPRTQECASAAVLSSPPAPSDPPTVPHTQTQNAEPQTRHAHTEPRKPEPTPKQAHPEVQHQPQPPQAHTQHAQPQPQPTQAHTQHAQPKPQHTQPPSLHAQPQPCGHTRLSSASSGPPPSRPMPLLTAKPYSQPKHIQTGHKAVKVEGLVHVNGKSVEEGMSVPLLPSAPLHSPEGSKAPPTQQATANQTANETLTPQQPELVATTTSGSSAISSLIGGRNCIVTTTIVTELSQTYMEPYPSNLSSNTQINGTMGLLLQQEGEQKEVLSGSAPFSYQQTYSPTVTEGLEESNVTIETPMLNLAKRVNHWVWDPNEERKRQERWQQEQERLLQEQYQREQGKLKEEWERAQREVEEDERRHNEEERQILEETAAPLNLSTLSKQPSQVEAISSAQQDSLTKTNAATAVSHKVATITLDQPDLEIEARDITQQNNQRVPMMSEDQHGVSQLRFVQDASWENERKQELWKTSSLDRNAQIIQPSTVKRSGSHDIVGTHSPSSSPQPTLSSRCVSGKKLCSGCSLTLGKGAAMIIDTLGLFFHIQCFKCGVCEGQLGTTRAGTDVRIRNGVLNCHECYITSCAAGHPTTL
ncbi:LIM and calponin homology domains-containing protein 1-like isoform X3 [Osmerus eperlanus]|uniref:LIM and calponin homology domains-containing protein 1-like isoform X3 n=1 Tax=Osmerus eperlanus TaxID=29151 RepID=UPI002E12B84D